MAPAIRMDGPGSAQQRSWTIAVLFHERKRPIPVRSTEQDTDKKISKTSPHALVACATHASPLTKQFMKNHNQGVAKGKVRKKHVSRGKARFSSSAMLFASKTYGTMEA